MFLTVPAPQLGGSASELWVGESHCGWRESGGWHLAEGQEQLWACAVVDARDSLLEHNTHTLYEELLRLCVAQGYRLQRAWHYLPRINEPDASGLERYRIFCRGRSLAFESIFGEDFHACLPAASAVGCLGTQLVIYACARRQAEVSYAENPLQVPAYLYPETYGPRAPGFARASVALLGEAEGAVVAPSARCEIFISGTASIRKELSQTEGGIETQLRITVENLNRIAEEVGLNDFLHPSASDFTTKAAREASQLRRFKVYLRYSGDYPSVSRDFGALLRAGDEVSYIHSDICRAELDIEIEASVFQAGI